MNSPISASDSASKAAFLPPFCTAITGADDEVPVESLLELQQSFPFVEWALLYLPEKEGQARNPTAAWRAQFLQQIPRANTALHLCGRQVFRDILAGTVSEEFSCYGRLQVNINARGADFTNAEVLAVYEALLAAGHRLILQCHDASLPLIRSFLLNLRKTDDFGKVDVLFDSSRGKGVAPRYWPAGFEFPPGTRCGYAGSLGPLNIADNLLTIHAKRRALGAYWLDMESNVRTDNHFNKVKARTALMEVARVQLEYNLNNQL